MSDTQNLAQPISCDNLTGQDLKSCQSLANMVQNNRLDLTQTGNQRTAYEYHRVVWQIFNR
ncbi:MAG: hypothetical protein SFV17_03030 [Candidatus Obscuribacter sp.]|nr:hypothetical protein [Candidatus Obscuribacter sp.]